MLAPLQFARSAVLCPQPGHRLALIATDPLRATLSPSIRPNMRVLNRLWSAQSSDSARLCPLWKKPSAGSGQERTDSLQALNLLVAHVSHHG